jgi:hypothetical protein
MKILDVPQSGSMAGQTSSRNRYGQYRRTRAIPVNPATAAQVTARNRVAIVSAAWRSLTDAQRAGWSDLAAQLNRTDALGQGYTLNGFGAFMSVNQNKLAAGDAQVTDAPALVSPATVATLAVTLTAASFSLAYTATPLAAGQRLFVYASPQRAAGRAYESDYRLVHVSAAAAASPANVLASYTARFGVPVVGNRIFVAVHVYQGGFRSGAFATSAVVA